MARRRAVESETMKLSVVISVYNEADHIREILKRVRATGLASDIVVVDDRSEDGTRAILQQSSGWQERRPPGVGLHDENRGKGAAARTGLQHAAPGDIILIQDADLQYDPRD